MHRKKGKETKMILSKIEVETAMRELKPNAFKLFIWFHGIPDEWVFKNKQVADAIGMSVRTMQYAKKDLYTAGYLFIDHEKRYDHYYVGKTMVQKFRKKFNVSSEKVG